jgi:hypothetical protein
MTPGIATVVCVVGILGLFALDRDKTARTSKALWIAVVWMSLAASRPMSVWLGVQVPIATADQQLELDGSPLDRNILTGLIAVGVIVLLRRRREVGALLRGNRPIVLLFLYCAVSILWSDFPDVALKRWTRAVGDLVMILIVLTDPDRPAAVKQFLARIGFLLMPASLLLIKYYPHLGLSWSEGRTFFRGVANDKNMLGMISMLVGLGCAWRLIRAFRGRERTGQTGPLIAQTAILAIVFLLLLRIDSLTSLACFALTVGLMVAASFPALTRSRAGVHLAVASVLCVGLTALFLDVGGGLVTMIGRDSTLTGRTLIWETLIGMNQRPLLGAGFESFWLGIRPEDVWGVREAHNGYLEVFLNLGWMGVALLTRVIATGYRDVISAFRRDSDNLGLAYFVAGALYSLSEAAFRMGTPTWILFLLAMMAVRKLTSLESKLSECRESVTALS